MITWHLLVACCLGAFVLGYLLAEWYFDGVLRKTDVKLEECASAIEQLVAENEDYSSLIDNMSSDYKRLLKKYQEYEAIFGENAVITYNEMAAENRRLLVKLNELETSSGRSRAW